MVSYYNTMYARQQMANNGHFQNNNTMPSWYPGGYAHGHGQMNAAPAGYLQQDDPQIWHRPHEHNMFHHNEFPDFVHTGIPPLQPLAESDNQMPSPPITVSGSEMSSPGGQSGTISPQQMCVNNNNNARPGPARSPYEWIKKTSYQSQPTPGKTRTKDKYRVVYTDHQRIELEKEFTFVNKYITIRRKTELAANLGLSERQVKIWFQNRRAKERKQNKKRVEEKHQIDLYNGTPMQNQTVMMPQSSTSPDELMNHHHHGAVMDNSQQSVLPTVAPSAAIQRYLHDQVVKRESIDLCDRLVE